MHPKMLPVKHLATYLFLVLFALFTFSCKKDPTSNSKNEQETENLQKNISEAAYPNVPGELIGVKLGNDSCYFRKINDKYIWMGDIVLDKAQKDSLIDLYKNQSDARTFHNDMGRLWPNAEVFYTIDPGFSAGERQQISNAISHWQSNTPLRFTARTLLQPNYIRFVPGSNGSGYYSTSIGMNGGQQIINLQSGFGTGNVIHEIGHNIGFYHEQSRTDRGNAIIVHYENVVPHTSDNIYQFQTYAEIGKGGFQIGNFDFGSVMLYSSFDASDKVHPVMTRLDGSTFIGQRNGLSAGDIETANYMYKPIYATITKEITSYSAPGDIYNDKRTEDYYIHFFSDLQHTQPVALSNRVLVNYWIYTTVFQQRVPLYTTVANSVTLEAGNNSYYLTSADWNLSYDPNMNPIDGAYNIDIGLASGVGYRQ